MKESINTLVRKQLTGTLSAEEKARLEAWLSLHPDAQTDYQALLDGEQLARRYREYASVDSEQAWQQFRRNHYPRVHQLHPRRWFAVAAAVVVLTVAGGLAWWHQYAKVVPPTISEAVQTAMAQSIEAGRQEAVIEPVAQQQDKKTVAQTLRQTYNIDRDEVVEQLLTAKRITTRSNREFWQMLPDGTLVHLNYNTHVVYPEQFTGETRDVVLDGEAYFMVARDRRHPFVVHTPQGDVKEYGTEFNVNTRINSGTEVVLVEGSISVTPTGSKEQMLRPGQKARMANGDCTMEEVDTEPYVAWNTGTFIFDDCTLGQLMGVLSRWYGCRVEFDSDATREMRFTGELDKYSSIEPILKAIQVVTGLDIELNKENITIKNNN